MPVASLFHGPTVRQQAMVIEQQGLAPTWGSLVPVQPSGSRPILFLVPPAGSTSVRFARLAQQLGPDQPLFGFDPNGLDDNSLPPTTVEEMATQYVHDLRQFQPDGPYLLGGMCFGGHVAYEMAQILNQQGCAAPVLLLLDVSQPHNGPSWSLPPRDTLYFWRRMLDYRREGHHLDAIGRTLFSRWRRLSRRLLHWKDPDLHRMAAVYEAQVSAMHGYRAEAGELRLVLYQSDDPLVNFRQRGWAALSDNLEIVRFPDTTHRSLLLEDDNIERIAEALRRTIDEWIAEYWKDTNH